MTSWAIYNLNAIAANARRVVHMRLPERSREKSLGMVAKRIVSRALFEEAGAINADFQHLPFSDLLHEIITHSRLIENSRSTRV
jgi:hypothetical protein